MVSTGFIALSVLMILIIITAYNNILKSLGTDKDARRKRLLQLIIPLFLWMIYVYLLGNSGFLNTYELPPRFPIFLILPLFAFTAFFLYHHRNSEVLHAIPKSWSVYYQTFRIGIESLFVASLADGLLPYQVTFEGYNMDILFACTAPLVAFFAFRKKLLSEKVVLLWNYLGLGIITSIIFLFFTATFYPSFWGSATSLASKEMGEFPFVLVPGFLMPSAVFMHILSIIQLRK